MHYSRTMQCIMLCTVQCTMQCIMHCTMQGFSLYITIHHLLDFLAVDGQGAQAQSYLAGLSDEVRQYYSLTTSLLPTFYLLTTYLLPRGTHRRGEQVLLTYYLLTTYILRTLPCGPHQRGVPVLRTLQLLLTFYICISTPYSLLTAHCSPLTTSRRTTHYRRASTTRGTWRASR